MVGLKMADKIIVDNLKSNSEAKKSGFKIRDFISEFKIENLDRPNKGIVYPFALLAFEFMGQ